MAGGRRVDRRTFLQGAASTVSLSGLSLAATPRPAEAVMDDRIPIRMAMHIHACFSEGDGSMEAHLHQAQLNGIDVIWWTEHDHRMVARGYVRDVHFNGLSEFAGDTGVVWRSHYSGLLSSSSATIVTSPVASHDIGGKALRLSATARPSSTGTRRVVADASNYGLNTSLDGTTIFIDVFPQSTGVDGWVDIQVQTSYRPARSGRAAGMYTLIYRIGGTRPAGDRQRLNALTALVVVDAADDEWTTLALDPVSDLNSFWGQVDFRDSALTEFSLAATSSDQVAATVVFDALTFERVRRTSDQVLRTQQELVDMYAPQFPSVTQHSAMELSQNTPHLSWFGDPNIWPAEDPANTDIGLAISRIHDVRGVASYNHPYGSSGGPYGSSQRTSKRRSVTSTLVKARLFGAEILEVGYLSGRAGMALSDYLAIWDVLSRNAIFATGTGTTDDHDGRSWSKLQWRCITGVWSYGAGLKQLQRALRAGSAWFADMAAFDGTINLLADGYIAMGQAAVIEKSRTVLDISVTDLPVNWSVVLVKGDVDEAGPSQPDPVVATRTFSAAEVVGGALSIMVNTSSSCFARVELRDANKVTRVFSNPVWLLRQLPVKGIPAVRLAEPPVPAPPA
jgi:hypothetical protein